MAFTEQQILEIKDRLSALAIKDTEFPEAVYPLNGREKVPIIQDDINTITTISHFLAEVSPFKGWFKSLQDLVTVFPNPLSGNYSFIGNTIPESIVYKCVTNGAWITENEKAIDYITILVLGTVKVGENGNWYNFNDTTKVWEDTKIKAQGPQGESFRYEDFTEAQLADLRKPAVDAAIECRKIIDELVIKAGTSIASVDKVVQDTITATHDAVEAANVATSTAANLQSIATTVITNTNLAIKRSDEATLIAQEATTIANKAAKHASDEAIVATEAAKFAELKGNEAEEVAHHPTIVGKDSYVYIWNRLTKQYVRTSIYLKGDPFAIKKHYLSVDLMNADIENPKILVGDIVIVSTVVYTDPDNSKLYTKINEGTDEIPVYSWVYLYQLSELIGPPGKIPKIITGEVTKGDEAAASLSPFGEDPEGNPIYKFDAVLPKGDRGATGEPGPHGPSGPQGVSGVTPIRGVDYWTINDVLFITEECHTYIDTALKATNDTVISLITRIG